MTADAGPDTCPRCGDGFACGISGTAPCPCTTVKVDVATLAQLRGAYSGCLCMTCLGQVTALAPALWPMPPG